ncbi:MAG: glycosyltransferase [Planctomycetes bacterium]|nr:glycosyltransferase [Planctomycetota bacterium]
MRIAFDVSPLARPHPRGVVRAVRGAVDALERRGELEVVRLAPADGEELRAWRHVELARRAEAAGCVGLHSFVSALPLAARIARVQTVHELPWRHGVLENADLAHRAWVQVGALVARRIAVPSEFVARDLRAELAVGADKVRVVPWGVGAPFTERGDAELERELVARLSLADAPFVLAPGATRPKKNLAATLRGLARLGSRATLVVTGAPTETLESDRELARELGVTLSIVGEVDDRELAALYRLSACTVVLSHSEGCALPVLEARACGAPVVVAKRGAAAELAGSRGFAAEAANQDEVAEALARAFAAPREPDVGASWDATAERLEALWRELASS